MRIAFFYAKDFEKPQFDAVNGRFGHEIRYIDAALNPTTAHWRTAATPSASSSMIPATRPRSTFWHAAASSSFSAAPRASTRWT